MKFENVYLVGRGTIAISICKSLLDYHKQLTVLLYDETTFSLFPNYLIKNNIKHIFFNSKADLSSYLENINSQSLIIHANCFYIYPKQVVSKDNLTIINFHYALLPKHRGADALIWSIFEQDEYSGITWHFVNEKLDAGNIIIQEKIKLDEHETPLSLSKKTMTSALNCFEKIKDSVLDNNIKSHPMPTEGSSYHSSKDFPNNKYLNYDWSLDKMYAFVRSMDYGMYTKPENKARIVYDNTEYVITEYKICPISTPDNISFDNNILNIIKDRQQLSLKLILSQPSF